jgi:uracil-DNA glycosylase family 4
MKPREARAGAPVPDTRPAAFDPEAFDPAAFDPGPLEPGALDPGALDPGADCPLCPRLGEYRQANRAANADWFNAPVPSFGSLDARLLVVGLAPGVRGANRTGRPFTGDFAGMLLYRTLVHFGLAMGAYGADSGDGLRLVDCRVTNAVRCVPPANLPTPFEIGTCNRFLTAELAAMKRLRGVLALGGTAHAAVLRACGMRPAHTAFRHGEIHTLPEGRLLADSYHVSRLNTNTGRLTEAMFHAVVEMLLGRIGPSTRDQGRI